MMSNSSFQKSPARSKNSAFQDLNLFFTDVEILMSRVYHTETASFFFSLKKYQCDLIRQNRKSIFLRFCSYEHSKALQKDLLPKDVNICINGCSLLLESKNSKEKNWKTPLEITQRCRPVTTRNANGLEIMLNNCKKLMYKGYGIEIILAHKLSISDQINMLKTNLFIRKTEETLKIIKKSCSGFEDIVCDVIKVPLLCCVTKKIIQLPLVGSKCRHVSCFEGQTFLEMHLNKAEWTCPICYNLIRKNELLRDPLIEDILHSTKRKVEQIEFDKCGNFKQSVPDNIGPKKQKIECVTLDDEDDVQENVQHNATTQLLTPKLERLSNDLTIVQNGQTPLNGSRTILENLDLLSSALQSFKASLNQNNTVTSSPTNERQSDNLPDNNDVIELSSGEENSIIVLDSDTDVDMNNHMLSNDDHSDSNDSSSIYNFLRRPAHIKRRAMFDDTSSEESVDDEQTEVDEQSSSDNDQTELSDESDKDVSNTRRKFVYRTSKSNSQDDSDESTSDSLVSNMSLESNSSLSTDSSESSSQDDTSSSSKSRHSLRRQRKKRKLIQY